ncbi:MAG: choice-of-anchor Q domain-containing protein, partial [Vicingaceae bacterium]
PFVVNDRINFITNGTTQSITLSAWGQDAHYFVANKTVGNIPLVYLDRDNSNSSLNVTWTDDKPYVIYGGYLTLDGDDKLTIEKGVRVHLHNGSGIWVYENGNISVNGTKDEPVTFQGTRLEHAYQDVSGQWDRIWINGNASGTDNVFNYAVIKNGFIGIQAEPDPFASTPPVTTNKLRLNNCKIHNNSVAGILAKNYQITDTNSIISNSGQHSLLVQGDGAYQFYHTTFANYWSESTRKTPSILLQNAYVGSVNNVPTTIVSNLTAVDFYNCIVHGDQEIEFDTEEISGGTINYSFTNCVLKTSNDVTGSNFTNIILNPTSTLFADKSNYDFHLADNSPAINAGDNSITVATDHDGELRSDGAPDIGAYEKQ